MGHTIATGLTRTVSLEVYLTYEDEGDALVTGESDTMLCNYDTWCPERTDCGGDSTQVQVRIVLLTTRSIYLCIHILLVHDILYLVRVRNISTGMYTTFTYFVFFYISYFLHAPPPPPFRFVGLLSLAFAH